MSRLPLWAFFISASLLAQRQAGELRLQVKDASGAPVNASGELTGQATDVHRRFTIPADGRATITALPFGLYQLKVERAGFEPATRLVEVRSHVPAPIDLVLGIAAVETTLQVSVQETLLNPDRTGAIQQLGQETLKDRRPTVPAREILSLVDAQPGWLLEANGVLHPRGSEYGVQYVIDGLPVLDNRSPVFAPMLDIDDYQSLVIRTGGYPAEYGHQLGGVVEVNTTRDERPGFHGRATVEGGGFATARIAASTQFVHNRDTFGLTGNGMQTDRYLDPPVEQNLQNHGSGGGFSALWQRNWSDTQRTRIILRRSRTGFLVPNEVAQELAGQRQDRTAAETAGQLSYTQTLSPRLLFDVRGSMRDISADLWSNPLSTPIAPMQSRGFREGYASASLSLHQGAHDIKFGAEGLFRAVREDFAYRIIAYRLNGVRVFDRDTPPAFSFSDRRRNYEQGAYIQDHIRLGAFTIDAGIRWDHYRFVVDEYAASPRLAAAWQIGGANGLQLRASYDRAFQTPAIENLLLASSRSAAAIGEEGLTLPVRPSRGNFYEAGFSKGFFGHLRLDGSYFKRDVRDFADDDLLLNTGVSFPIAFASASIHGIEAKLEIPRWGRFSGYVSYTNLTGRGRLPVAGGLFLEEDAADLLTGNDAFAITQDQRNTARGQLRVQVNSRVWVAGAAQYGSGLPVELEDAPNIPLLRQQYGDRVVDRVNFARGRIRPNFALDLSAGADLWRHESKTLRAQATVLNVTDRLNVINFAGLFSGTALAPRRWAAIRLSYEF